MGLIDSMKNAVRGTSEWLRSLRTVPTVEDVGHDYPRGYQRTTTASRRAERLMRGRMLHVSKPITDEVWTALDWGMPDLAAAVLRRQKGITHYSPRSHVKRAADELANDMGLNNKQRRYLRGRMVRRLEMGEIE